MAVNREVKMQRRKKKEEGERKRDPVLPYVKVPNASQADCDRQGSVISRKVNGQGGAS